MGKNKKDFRQSMCDLKNKLPLELTNSSVMEICSDRQITIDGCKGIVEYSDFMVRIKTSGGVVSICGRRLNIKYLSINSVVIEGKLLKLEFEDWA